MPVLGKRPNHFAAPVAKAYRPTMRDQVGSLLSSVLGNTYQGNRIARNVFGSSGLGGGQGNLLGGLGLLDLTPIGAAFALEEAGRQIGGGQPVTGAANVALGMVPIPAVAKGGKAVVRSAARRVAGSKAAKREAVNVFEDMAAPSIPRPVQLDMTDAARLARAREQGFDTARPFYHATGNAYRDYDLSRAGSASAAFDERAAFLTDNPKVADTYLGQQWINGASDDVERITGQRRPGDVVTIYNEGSNVRPYFIAPEKFEEWEFYGGGYRPGQMKEILKDARRERAPGALMDNIRDPGFFGLGGGTPSTQAAVVDTRAMRSIFDLFEPPRATSARKLPDGYSGEKRPRSPTNPAPPVGVVTSNAPDFALDDELMAIIQRDLSASHARDSIMTDVAGVMPGKLGDLDFRTNIGQVDPSRLSDEFSGTREALRQRYGNTVRLYRADPMDSEKIDGVKTLRMAAPSLARRFAIGGRQVTPRDVPVDDIVAAIARGNGYHEIIVKNPNAHSVAPPKPQTRRK